MKVRCAKKQEREMATVDLPGQMVLTLKDTGLMVKQMAEAYSGLLRRKYLKENGKKTKQLA